MTDEPTISDFATQLLLARLDTQDKMQDRILHEVKRTNGNVITLDARVTALEGAKSDSRLTAIEEGATAAHAVEVHVNAEDALRRWRMNLWVPVVAVVLSGAFGSLAGYAGHALGAW